MRETKRSTSAVATRRQLLAFGGATAGTALISTLSPGSAVADDLGDMGIIKDAPVNAKHPDFWNGIDTETDLGDALADAISYARDNGLPTVLAPAGTYAVDGLELPAGLTLRGEGPSTELQTPESGVVGLILSGDGSRVTDLKIVGVSSALPKCSVSPRPDPCSHNNDGTIEVRSSHCAVERVTVVDSPSHGIFVKETAANVLVSNCRIFNSIRDGITGRVQGTAACEPPATSCVVRLPGLRIVGNFIDNLASGGKGILVGKWPGDPTNRVRQGILVAGNRVKCRRDGDVAGIELYGGHEETVVRDNVIDGGSIGISLSRPNRATASGNVVRGSIFAGIEIAGTTDNPEDPENPPPPLPPDAFDNDFTEHVTVTGNVILGTTEPIYDEGPDLQVTRIGIAAANRFTPNTLRKAVIHGNSISGCRSGILVSESESVAVTGNSIQAAEDPDQYIQKPGDDATNDWAGISFRGGSRAVVCSGNTVDGLDNLPAGIKFNSAWEYACVGNTVRRVAPQFTDPPDPVKLPDREIYVHAAWPSQIDNGNAPQGVIFGNDANVVTRKVGLGGVGNVKIDANSRYDVPVVTQAHNRLTLTGGPTLVHVTSSGTVRKIANLLGGHTNVEESYAGREVTLLFSSGTNFKNGGNLVLSSELTATGDGSITFVCDGEKWIEVSRSLN